MSSVNVMGNKTRKMVYKYISLHPGVPFSTIMTVLDLTEGTLRYHLNYLERGNKILSKPKGNHKYYFVNKISKAKISSYPNFDFQELSKDQQRLTTIIQHHPGISVRELTKITKLNKRTLQYNIKKLRDQMIIWKVGNGKNTGYEFVTKEKLKNELFRLLIIKFLRDEIDEDTFRSLKEELEKERL